MLIFLRNIFVSIEELVTGNNGILFMSETKLNETFPKEK